MVPAPKLMVWAIVPSLSRIELRVLEPDRVRAPPAEEIYRKWVTLDPIVAPTVTVPVLELSILTVPTLLSELPLIAAVEPEVPALVRVTFPVPVIEPLIVKLPEVPVTPRAKLLPFKSMSPLKAEVTVVPLLEIVVVPTAPEPIVIALDTVMPVEVFNVAAAPSDAPSVIATVEGPAAPLVVPLLLTPAMKLPLLIVVPPVKVLAPETVKAPLLLF